MTNDTENSGESRVSAPPPAEAGGTPIEAPPRGALRQPSPEAVYGAKRFGAGAAAGLAIFSGVLYWAAFPGIDVWPFAFVCWAPLLLAAHRQTPRRALWLGALMGLTCNVLGFYWLFGMLKTFSGFNDLLCGFFMLVLCGYQGGRMGLMTWLFARAERKGWPAAACFALAFVAHETIYPLLFPWYTGAQTHTVPLLMQTAELGGPIFVGLCLLGGSVAIAEISWAKWIDKRPMNLRLVGIALAGPVFMFLWGAIRVPMVQHAMDAAPSAKVALVQGDMPLGGGRDALPVHRNETIKAETEQHPDLVVWSEAAIPFSIRERDMPMALRALVMNGIHTPVVAGLVIERDTPGEKTPKLFNSAALVEPDGRVDGVYDKTYLLAFGEYIPFGDWFPQLYEISRNSGRLTKGSSLEPLRFPARNGQGEEHRITVLICYEDILPYFVNGAVRRGDPDLLVNMTNDAWFGKSTEPGIHLALAKLRAVEHRRFLVRATNTGVTAFVDALGRSSHESELFVRTTQVGEIRWMRAHTLYEIIGDKLWWLLTIVVIAMGFVRRVPSSDGGAGLGKLRFEWRHDARS